MDLPPLPDRADISGIKALKRRIEQRTQREGGDARNVKTGHGGIRDIEFVIQFLQLLNGGDLPGLRTGNTLEAIAQLEQVGCLTNQERSLLEENYTFLRKIEHRLQIMFDLQTHLLPESDDELRKLALRMGYADRRRTARRWRPSRPTTAEDGAEPQDPRPPAARRLRRRRGPRPKSTWCSIPTRRTSTIAEVLGKYRFRDVKQAYRNLMALAEEKISFLSTRRCRHFLAAIAPAAAAGHRRHARPRLDAGEPEPGERFAGRQGRAVGAVQLQSAQAAAVRASSAPTALPVGHPHQQPGHDRRADGQPGARQAADARVAGATLADLCRGAEDIDPILHSFKNDQQLCVGVRDMLGKEDVQATHRRLSDIAEVCLADRRREYERLAAKFGDAADRRRAARASPARWSSWRWASSAAAR